MLERELGIEAHARGNEVRLVGAEASVELARRVLEDLYDQLRKGRSLKQRDVREAIQMLEEAPRLHLDDPSLEVLSDVGSRRPIRAKNLAQRRYVEMIRSHELVLSVGPAGTGKTYLAMAMAVAALNRQEVTRVILTRPAVEAGEKLGFLPGDLAEKVNPYLRPLYDALHDMMTFEKVERLMERGVIEVAPLAFMRGRTLNDCFVILDEAQNTTPGQMKMFLTRLGFNSRAVVTGDVTQTDLEPGARSGLAEALRVLEDVEGIEAMYFSDRDVVRHPLVQAIIRAYERADETRERESRQPVPGVPDVAEVPGAPSAPGAPDAETTHE